MLCFLFKISNDEVRQLIFLVSHIHEFLGDFIHGKQFNLLKRGVYIFSKYFIHNIFYHSVTCVYERLIVLEEMILRFRNLFLITGSSMCLGSNLSVN